MLELKQVAIRIKDLREIAGVSAESLAKEFNIPLEKYTEYESGNVDIPVSVLYEIANKFNVELTQILTGDNPHLHTYCLVRKGKGVEVERRKDYSYESLAFNFIHKKAEPFLVTVSPEAPFSLNSHPGQEFNYVLQGSIQITIDGHEMVLNEGDSLFFDSSYQHGMKALGGGPAQFLAIIF
jgi:mannose-6-phosphate isomerase-like protein (cupin superfamily)